MPLFSRTPLPSVFSDLAPAEFGPESTLIEPFGADGYHTARFLAAQPQPLRPGASVILGDPDRERVKLVATIAADPERVHRRVCRLFEELTADGRGRARGYYAAVRDLWNYGSRYVHYQVFLRLTGTPWATARNGHLTSCWDGKWPPELPPLLEFKELAAQVAGIRRYADVSFLAWSIQQYEATIDPAADEEEQAAAQEAHASGNGTVWIGPGCTVFLDLPQDAWEAEGVTDLIRLARLWTSRGAHVVARFPEKRGAESPVAAYWPRAHRQADGDALLVVAAPTE